MDASVTHASLIRHRIEIELVEAMARAGRDMMTWGVDDCARWCASILKAALGYDASARWGRYDSRDGAARALGQLGLGFALRSAARTHGWRRIDPVDARVGDIGLALLPAPAEGPPELLMPGTVFERLAYPTALRPATMICRAPGWFVARSEAGFTGLTHKVVRLAWSVVP